MFSFHRNLKKKFFFFLEKGLGGEIAEAARKALCVVLFFLMTPGSSQSQVSLTTQNHRSLSFIMSEILSFFHYFIIHKGRETRNYKDKHHSYSNFPVFSSHLESKLSKPARKMQGVSDGSAVRSSSCFSGGSPFGSQHPHGDSQPSVTAGPGDPRPSSDLASHEAYLWCSHTCRHNTHINEMK